jgi:hypothetical protein
MAFSCTNFRRRAGWPEEMRHRTGQREQLAIKLHFYSKSAELVENGGCCTADLVARSMTIGHAPRRLMK